jgi:glutamine synthetase adenylyltransferase
MPLKVSDGIGTWIDDFKKSKAPQFKGKSEKERRDMAIAAYLSAKRGGKPQSTANESVIYEESDKSTDRLKMLVRLGLMDKKDMTKIVRSIGKMKEDKPVSPADRKILFDLLNELIGMVTGDEQIFQKAKKAVREEKDPNEYDKEGEMMKNQLRQICSANEKLMKMVGDDDNLPEWVQNKVTKATDYIRSVRDYLEAENGDDDEKEMDEAKRTVTIDKPDRLSSIRVIKPKDPSKFNQDKKYPPHLRGDSIGKARKTFKDMRRSSTGK